MHAFLRVQANSGPRSQSPFGVFFLSAAPGVFFLLAAPEMAGVGSAVRRLYLAVYNWIVFAGWCVLPSAALLALALFPVSWIRHGIRLI